MLTDNELRLAVAEVAKSAGNDPRGKSAYAETIIRMLEPNHLSLDLFSAFMPTVQLMPGDELQYKVRKGRYPVRTMVPGTMHLTDQVYVKDKIMRVFDRLVAGTSWNLWEVNSGEVGTVESMRSDLRADITDNIVARVFNLLTSVWNSTDTPNNYTDASSGGVTATILDNMIETVLERAGNVKAIIGQRRALLPLYNFATSVSVTVGTAGTAIPTDRFPEFYNNNRVTSYKGIPLVELGQVFTNSLPDVNEKLIRTDVIAVIGDNAGEIALYDTFQFQDWTDMRKQPAEYVLHGWQAYSLIVDQPDRIGIIKTNT